MTQDAPAKTIVITGASDGVGAAAARQLTERGHRVVVVGRSPEKTRAVAEPLGAPHHLADFADLSQVRALAAELAEAYPRIDVLANNAGGIMGEREITVDGFEKTFQVNHLAGFLLTRELMPTLTASDASVIQTASQAARFFARFDIDDLQNAQRYSPRIAYGNGKLENILFTRELQRRHGDEGISAVAFHPGVVASNFASETNHVLRLAYRTPIRRLVMITPEDSARRLVALAEGTPGTDWQPGEYYEKTKVARTAAAGHDPEMARRLWERSEELLG